MVRAALFVVLSLALLPGCDPTAPVEYVPPVLPRVQCIGEAPPGLDLFPIANHAIWTFEYVIVSYSQRQGSTERLPGTLTWTFGRSTCQNSVWVTPVTERAVMEDGFVYAEAMATVRETRGGRLQYVNDRTRDREVTFVFELDRFQVAPPDTVRLNDIPQGESVSFVPGRGAVQLKGSHYYGLGLTRTLDAAR